MPIIYGSQYWTPANNVIRLEVLLGIIGSKLQFFLNNKSIYYCGPTSAIMPMELIKRPSASIKPRKDLDHRQVGNWTLKCEMWNQTTDKLISPNFDILDSVQIDHLKNVCYFLIVLIQSELITCQTFVLLW